MQRTFREARVRARAATLLACAAALALPLVVLAARAPGKPARTTPLNDANIVAIVLAANDGDIANGRLAARGGGEPSVRAFGRMMVADHTTANRRSLALVSKLGLRPVHNATSRGLVKSAEEKHAELARLRGTEFDRAYMDAEVTVHEAVLELLDQRLIPAARSEELRDLLAAIRPVVAAHLDRAKQVRGNLRD